MVEIAGADDEVGGVHVLRPVRVAPPQARHLSPLAPPPTRSARADGCDRGPRVDLGAVLDREVGDRLDEPGETALGVLDSAGEVERAHQVVEAGGPVGGGAEEYRGVAEDLPQADVGEPLADEVLQRLGEEREEPRQHTQDLGGGERRGRGEVRVEEVPQGDVVGVAGGLDVCGERLARSWLDRLEGCDVVSGVGADVEPRWPRLSGRALEEDPVGRIEGAQVELLLGGGAEKPEEVVEHLGHEVPGRAGVEPEAVGAE